MEPQKIGADRSGMLERYHEAVGMPVIEKESAPVAAKTEASSDSANNKSQSADQPEAGPTEKLPNEPVAKEVVVPDPGVKKAVEKQEEPKTVPLEALHEAREKFKAKNLEARKLQEQLSAKDQELSELKNRVSAMEDTIRQAKGESDDTPDEVVKLTEENKKLKEAQAKSEQEKILKTQQDAERETARLITVADESLDKEGFPGFKRFGRDVYEAIVAKIKSGELEEKDVTTALWAKVYREEVYPQVKSVFTPQTEQEKLAAKKKQKQAANLVRNPGESPAPKEEDNLDAPQTAESYMKVRKILK